MKTQIILFTIALFFTITLFGQQIHFSPGDSTVVYKNVQEQPFRHMPFQFTLLFPPLTTNGIDFYKTANDISVNTFLGISAATEMFEAGGFTNINLYYTKGIQAAGFANITSILGNEYESEGVQVSGFANLCGTKYTGVQASGFANISKEISGLQAAGFFNATEKANDAVQAAGFANVTLQAEHVFQASGFANVALEGKSMSQIAGFGNVAQQIKGVQIAGFTNIAKNVKGVQLSGFINICDSIDGVPISFISFVRKNGYRSYEISTSEWAPMQISFKMGVKELYNIYTLSKLISPWDRYAFGFGFGHTVALADHMSLQLELTNHSSFRLWTNNAYNDYYNSNQMLQFKPSFKREIGNEICLNFGPTLNFVYGYRWGDESPSDIIQPFWKRATIQENNNYQSLSRLWVGFNAGISFR